MGKRASIKASRYAHAKQFKRMRRSLNKLRTYVGRLIRDIERKVIEKDDDPVAILTKAEQLRNQQPQDANKLYGPASG